MSDSSNMSDVGERILAISLAVGDLRACIIGLCPDGDLRRMALSGLSEAYGNAVASIEGGVAHAWYALDDGLDETYAPNRAHDTDAGSDLRTVADVTVPAHGSAEVHTGVHVELPHGYCGLLVSKSRFNVVSCMTTTGLIDEGFSGEIRVRVYNHGDTDYHFRAGDEVTQMVLLPALYVRWARTDKVSGGERGDNGYGSTGR